MKTISTIALNILLISTSAQATLNTAAVRGSKINSFISKTGVKEICVIPKHYPGAKYKQRDLEKENELCSYNANPAVTEAKPIFLCAKDNSTNPGVNFHMFDATKNQVTCKTSDKKAKYKNSTSCSYTPSILAYYHFSRILGNIGHVPPTVIRTLDLELHKKVSENGMKATCVSSIKLLKDQSLICQNWATLNKRIRDGAKSSSKDALFTDDITQSYGALSENPGQDETYAEFFNGGADRAVSYRNSNKVFAGVKSSKPVSALVSSQWTQENVQRMMAMKDSSEFILLDHILNQKDRFGNIHYQPKYVYFKRDTTTSAFELNFEKKETAFNEDLARSLADPNKRPVLIKSILLKDNDCGVGKKANVAKAAGLLKLVAHMDPKTYKKVQQLAQNFVANKDFFKNELLFTEDDYADVSASLIDAAKILKTNCQNKSLQLDLDAEQYFTTGQIKAWRCE